MKHKAKSFIAVLLALCLMMSLGVGALAVNSDEEQEPNYDVTVLPEGTTYTVTIEETTGGDVTAKYVDNGEEKDITDAGIPANSTVKLYVTPENGYKFISIKYGDSYPGGVESPYYFTINSNVTITATFKKIDYSVKISDTTNGAVTANKDTAQVGDTVNLTITPAEGHELDTLKVSQSGGSEVSVNNNTFTMPASDVTVTATFKPEPEPEPKYYVSASDLYCTVEVEGGEGKNFEAGDTVTFTVEPDAGYIIKSVWLEPYKELTALGDGKYSFVMPGHNVKIHAVCERWVPDWDNMHNVDTWSNSVDGGISVGDDADMALAGSTVTFRVWHNYRYDYYDYDVYVLNDRTGNRVSLDYSAYDDEYSFIMPDDDVTIYVYFDYAGRYSITKDVEGDGSIYVRSSADHGDTVWIEAAPSAGQSLTSLRVFYGEPWAYGDKGYYGYWDEAEVKYSTYWDAYYFTMPADDVVVYARFTDGATVDVVAGDHGDAKVSSRYAEKGDWVYITAYPDEGYEVDSVTVTDSLGRSVKVTELSYDYFLFTMPGTNVDVKVTFRAKDYDVFYDVSRGDWYYKAVRFVHEKGIMEGTGTHYFSPEADLSRGMLATILYRLEGSPAVSGYSGFADVADTAYYAKAVAWAKANGIVNGVTATAYEPDTAVTREELAAILCRYAAFKGKDTAISYDYLAGFSDANTSHVYARPALNWAVAYDIINGQGNGVLAPRATATRAEVAQVLMNYLEVFD